MKNRVAIVTGGNTGIGYGIAVALIREGINVAITSRSQQRADEAAERLRKEGSAEVLPIAADVRQLVDQQNVVKATLDKWGQVDLFVANAGVGHFRSEERRVGKECRCRGSPYR